MSLDLLIIALSYEDNFFCIHAQFCTVRYHLLNPFKLVVWSTVSHEVCISMVLFSQKFFDSLSYSWCLARFNCFNLVGNEVGISI